MSDTLYIYYIYVHIYCIDERESHSRVLSSGIYGATIIPRFHADDPSARASDFDYVGTRTVSDSRILGDVRSRFPPVAVIVTPYLDRTNLVVVTRFVDRPRAGGSEKFVEFGANGRRSRGEVGGAVARANLDLSVDLIAPRSRAIGRTRDHPRAAKILR